MGQRIDYLEGNQGGEIVSNLFKQTRPNIYSIEPANRVHDEACDVVLDVLEDSIDELRSRFGFSRREAFILLEQKMEEVRDKQEVRYRVIEDLRYRVIDMIGRK